MFQPSTLTFLKALKKNNNRDWFEKNRGKYEEALEDYKSFVGKLITEFSKINPGVKDLEVKNCVFRIYRDVRFSKNKEPYKPNFGASITEGGRKSPKAGFYFHLEPGTENFIGGGCWMPESELLKKIRQEIDYNFKDFQKIVNDKNFKKHFSDLSDYKLKTTPKGYSSDHPGIEYLKQTSFIIGEQLKDEDLLSKSLLKKCTATYQAMMPMLKFLNTAME